MQNIKLDHFNTFMITMIILIFIIYYVMKYNEITENFSTYGYVACPPQFTKVGSTQNMYYNAGNIGIGIDSPIHKLDVNGGGRVIGELKIQGPNRTSHICYNNGNTYIRGGSTAGNVLLNDNGGNVGIGTGTPGKKLDINGTLRVSQRSEFTGGIYLHNDWVRVKGNGGIYWENHGGGWHMTDTTWIRSYNNKNVLINKTLAVNGNIGIGNTNPTHKLDVRSDDTYIAIFKHTNNTQGIGIGYNSINALGNTANQDINITPRGSGVVRCLGNSLHIAKTDIDNTIQDQLVLECHNSAQENGNAILFRNRWNNHNVKWDMARIKAIEQGGYGGQLIFETNHGSGSLDTTTNEAMRIDEWGRIGMASGSGEFEPKFNVHIGGYVGGKNDSLYAFHHSGDSWKHNGGRTWNTSGHNIGLCVDARIIAAGMYIMSDYRIKKEIKEINEVESLNIIRKIKPKRYKLKETNKICYGFIAQEIDKIVPDIVSKCKNYISDIMIIAKVEKINNTSKLNTNVNHTLNKDDIIRCKNSNDTNIDNIKILEVIDDNTVIIDKIFSDSTIIICGRLVDDYHSIDHDMIMTLGISTIKKLDSEVTKLKEIIEKQQEQIELLIKSIKK